MAERDVRALGDQLVVLGDRAGDADRVALLESVGADGGRAHLTGDEIIGIESMKASHNGVTMLVAAGPEVTMATPGRPVAWA